MARRAHQRPAAKPHLRTEHLHQRAAAHPGLTDHCDHARHAARHVVERLRESRQRLRPPPEAVQIEPAQRPHVGEGRVVGPRLGLRAPRGAHELVEVAPVLGGRGGAEREGEPDREIDHPAGEAMRAHRREQPRRDRLGDDHRAVHHHQQLVPRQRDGVGAAQAAAHQHHELAEHHVHAARVHLRPQLGEPRRHRRHHHHRPHRRHRARQNGQLGGGQVRCEIVGEHVMACVGTRRGAAAAAPTAPNPRAQGPAEASRAVPQLNLGVWPASYV